MNWARSNDCGDVLCSSGVQSDSNTFSVAVTTPAAAGHLSHVWRAFQTCVFIVHRNVHIAPGCLLRVFTRLLARIRDASLTQSAHTNHLRPHRAPDTYTLNSSFVPALGLSGVSSQDQNVYPPPRPNQYVAFEIAAAARLHYVVRDKMNPPPSRSSPRTTDFGK